MATQVAPPNPTLKDPTVIKLGTAYELPSGHWMSVYINATDTGVNRSGYLWFLSIDVYTRSTVDTIAYLPNGDQIVSGPGVYAVAGTPGYKAGTLSTHIFKNEDGSYSQATAFIPDDGSAPIVINDTPIPVGGSIKLPATV